jgi:hypothetical protein
MCRIVSLAEEEASESIVGAVASQNGILFEIN